MDGGNEFDNIVQINMYFIAYILKMIKKFLVTRARVKFENLLIQAYP